MSPCKDCPRQGCGIYHDNCPDYIAFKNARKEVHDKQRDSYVRRNYGALPAVKPSQRRGGR